MVKIILIGLFLLLPFTSHAGSEHGKVETSAALDFYAPVDFDSSEANRLGLRSAELNFSGSLDSTFDATLNLAAHNEDGELKPEVHEAYLSTSKLLPSSRFKLGKFFLGVGVLNQVHQHDWVFTSAPRVQRDFFQAETVIDSGLEFTTAMPFFSSWDLTLGVTNGYEYGHSTTPGAKPHVPTHYIHPVTFVDFGAAGGLHWGVNYLGRTDAEGVQTQLYGLDFVFKKTEGKVLEFLLQSEIWYRNLGGTQSPVQEDLGAYIYSQIPVTERLFAGARIDLFKELSKKFAGNDDRQENFNYAFVPTLTYNYSEFTKFRASYSYDKQTNQGEAERLNQKVELQLTLVLEDEHG